MLEEVIKASNETIFLNEEQYVLVVDLFIFRPELQLEVTGLSVFSFSQSPGDKVKSKEGGLRRDGVENKDLRERRRERLEREARWDLRYQRYRLGLKMVHSAHCRILLGKLISDLDGLNIIICLIISHSAD